MLGNGRGTHDGFNVNVERVVTSLWTLSLARLASFIAATGMAILAWNIHQWTDRVDKIDDNLSRLEDRVLVIETIANRNTNRSTETLNVVRGLSEKLSKISEIMEEEEPDPPLTGGGPK